MLHSIALCALVLFAPFYLPLKHSPNREQYASCVSCASARVHGIEIIGECRRGQFTYLFGGILLGIRVGVGAADEAKWVLRDRTSDLKLTRYGRLAAHDAR